LHQRMMENMTWEWDPNFGEDLMDKLEQIGWGEESVACFAL
jgi:hypothetical protein